MKLSFSIFQRVRAQATNSATFSGLIARLWKTLDVQCRQAGLGDEPPKVFDEISEIALVDVLLPTRNSVTLRKRCISQPNQHQLILLQRLGLHLPAVPEFASM